MFRFRYNENFSEKIFFICLSIERKWDFLSRGLGSPTSFLHLSALTIFFENVECGHKCYACCQRSCRKHSLQKTDCVYTQAMLALIWNWKRAGRKIDEVYRQIICLLSMIITESRHTVFAKTCLCLYTGYACCQRKIKFRLDSFFERKNFHFSLKPCVRTYHKASDFSFTWYVRTSLFHLEWKNYADLLL